MVGTNGCLVGGAAAGEPKAKVSEGPKVVKGRFGVRESAGVFAAAAVDDGDGDGDGDDGGSHLGLASSGRQGTV